MIGWLKNLNDNSRLLSINEASRISGISAKALEKDWWVTLTLKHVFNTPYAKYFAFKGGTSLSKGWQIINRFSEDIDISLSAEVLGIEYLEAPSKTFVEQLRRAACTFTSNELLQALKRYYYYMRHTIKKKTKVFKQTVCLDTFMIYIN